MAYFFLVDIDYIIIREIRIASHVKLCRLSFRCLLFLKWFGLAKMWEFDCFVTLTYIHIRFSHKFSRLNYLVGLILWIETALGRFSWLCNDLIFVAILQYLVSEKGFLKIGVGLLVNIYFFFCFFFVLGRNLNWLPWFLYLKIIIAIRIILRLLQPNSLTHRCNRLIEPILTWFARLNRLLITIQLILIACLDIFQNSSKWLYLLLRKLDIFYLL